MEEREDSFKSIRETGEVSYFCYFFIVLIYITTLWCPAFSNHG